MREVRAGVEAEVAVTVNGRRVVFEAGPRRTLAESLRTDAGLTSVRVGCAEGVCGTCTVSLDGKSIRSCLMLTLQADGSEVSTVEGLGDAIEDLRRALIDHGAFQCGFCASGVVVTAAEFLVGLDGDVPVEADVRAAVAGSLCRCTGYQKIIAAITEVARARSVTTAQDR